MKQTILSVLIVLVALIHSQYALAADSYRYLHVTIDTPWAIFIFLLLIILFPFVLSAILYWYFTFKKTKINLLKNLWYFIIIYIQNNKIYIFIILTISAMYIEVEADCIECGKKIRTVVVEGTDMSNFLCPRCESGEFVMDSDE